MDKLIEHLVNLKSQISNVFKTNNIYVGGIDTRYSDDDDLWEIFNDAPPSGLRFCFSNHDSRLYIPFSVLATINDIATKYSATITLEQNPGNMHKPLYLYLNVDLELDKIKQLLNVG